VLHLWGMNNESSAPQPSVLRTRGFDAFCITYYERTRRYLYSELADPQLALDFAQETFASAFAASKKFRGKTPQEEWAWLKTIATTPRSRGILSALRAVLIARRSAVAERTRLLNELQALMWARGEN
jgi:hypothetical protein